MKIRKLIGLAIFPLAAFLYTSCSKNTEDNKPATGDPLPAVEIRELPADPATRDLNDGHLIGEDNRYTFFRFSDSTIVLADSIVTPRTDSATTKWDIAFRGTSILLNSGASGPGTVEGQVVKSTFEDLAEAPKTGYEKDTETGNVFSSWYNYNPQTHVITPIPGYILVIHTNDGKYVKMEILSYYKGLPAHPSVQSDQRYYTFRYVIQPDGSRSFEK